MPEEPLRPLDQARLPLRIGLTGGIASGKSAAARVFAALGVPVIDSDQIARDVVAPGTSGLARVAQTFGPQVLDADGRLDRKRLRGIVFEDAAARRQLEEIVHPLIRATMDARSAAAGGPYQVLVIPLLVENRLDSGVDRILVVDCTEDAQVERVMQRDHVGASEARAILRAQASRAERLALADDVIVNDADLAALERKVREFDGRYRLLAAERARRA